MNIKCLCLAPILLVPFWSTAEEPVKPKPAQVAGFEYDGTTITTLSVKDMKAAQRWYATVLGTTVFYELESEGFSELTTSCPNAMVGISEQEKPETSHGFTLSYGVKDIAQAKAWLEKNKVALDGDVIEIPKVVKLLYFKDPDGNRLMFYQPLKG